VNQGIYSEDATTLTYRRLRQIAQKITTAGFCVIVDASFLLQAQRQGLLEKASASGCPCVVVECDAPLDELRKRISERRNDPSEADLQVLEQQIQRREPVKATEAGISGIVTLDTGGPGEGDIDRIRAMLLP
jgi:predicted kinase